MTQMLKDWPPPASPSAFFDEVAHGPGSGSVHADGYFRWADAASVPAMAETDDQSGTLRSAAIFDLDRTLLAGASGPIIGEALRSVGLITRPAGTVESIAFGIFNTIGETWPSMLITRQGARAAKGWSVAKVREAAKLAVEPLSHAVLPMARQLMDEHRAAGRTLVMATTTPVDVIEPLAEALGFDQVLATRYSESDGQYDGTIDGLFVWGKGKARSVKEWASMNDIDLASSYAYSDSYYDVPLLSIVGNPFAVNPDPRLMAQATVRRWPIIHFDVPAGVPKFAGLEPQKVLYLLAQPQLFPWVRLTLEGMENIPTTGPAIIVGNHRSYFDPFAIGFLMAKVGRPIRFLGKKEVFDAPLVGDVITALGGIRVERGSGSDEPLETAEEALAAGEIVVLMPQGTIPRGPAFFDPVLKGRWGAARLAEASGAPVIPVGLWGTEKVWPRSSLLPNVMGFVNPPRVLVRAGAPVDLGNGDIDERTRAIMDGISAMLPPEASQAWTPSYDDLALTYPHGVVPDDVASAGDHERDRRPGTD